MQELVKEGRIRKKRREDHLEILKENVDKNKKEVEEKQNALESMHEILKKLKLEEGSLQVHAECTHMKTTNTIEVGGDVLSSIEHETYVEPLIQLRKLTR